MGIYAILKKEFMFLAKTYGFRIFLKQKHGSYYFIIWDNSTKKIMVLYDLQDTNPMSIRVYDSDYFAFDAVEYRSEFELSEGKPKNRIRRAAQWLRDAIENKQIPI